MRKEQNFTSKKTLVKQKKRNLKENWKSHKLMLRSLPLKKKWKPLGLVHRVLKKIMMKRLNGLNGKNNDVKA